MPRPEETEVEDNTTDSRTNTVAVIEGETVFEDTYVKSVETEIIIDRTFKTPGYVYNLSLIRWSRKAFGKFSRPPSSVSTCTM